MNKPSSKRKKTTSTASSDGTAPDNLTKDQIPQEENPATATITVTAVEVPELTDEEQSDKPNGMAPLTAFTLNAKWNGHFLRQARH
jgi:hypothetical protein